MDFASFNRALLTMPNETPGLDHWQPDQWKRAPEPARRELFSIMQQMEKVAEASSKAVATSSGNLAQVAITLSDADCSTHEAMTSVEGNAIAKQMATGSKDNAG